MANKLKLTIELVPATAWFRNIRSEFTGKDWDLIRKRCYQNADYKCEICGGKGKKHPVECHEEWEYNDSGHFQVLKRFIALCPSCHEVKHIGLAQLKGHYSRALKHFMKVNKVTKAAAHKYMIEVREKWEERSQNRWIANMSYVQEYTDGKVTL